MSSLLQDQCVSMSDFNNFVSNTSSFQHATATYMVQMSMCMASLCDRLFSSDHVLLSKPQVVTQQLQMQALSMEVDQLRNQLSCVMQENVLLKEELVASRKEVVSLVDENVCLTRECREKDDCIGSLADELSCVADDVVHLRSQLVELNVDRVCLEAKLDDVSEKMKSMSTELDSATLVRSGLELEIARLKQNVHSQLSDDFPLYDDVCFGTSDSQVVQLSHSRDDKVTDASYTLEDMVQGSDDRTLGGGLSRVVTV